LAPEGGDNPTRPFASAASVESPHPSSKDLALTRDGLLGLLVGSLIGWIPVLAYVGLPFAFVGVLLLFAGRRSLGIVHERTLVLALALLVVACIVASLSIGYVFGYSAAMTWQLGDYRIAQGYHVFLLGASAATVLFGFSMLLATREIQGTIGKAALWLAFLVHIANALVVIYVFGGTLAERFVDSRDLAYAVRTLPAYFSISLWLYALPFGAAWVRVRRAQSPPAPQPTPAG
jgi:hypothetical protein